MDRDALIATNRNDWDRLNALASQTRLDGEQADELIELYQRTAADLSEVKSTEASSELGDWLSLLLSKSRIRFTGAGQNLLNQLPAFFSGHLPAALYRIGALSLFATFFSVSIAFVFGLWVYGDSQVMRSFGSDAQFQQLVNQDFVNYYSENPAASFTGQVWTNNAWIAAQSIAFGITGVFVPYVLFQNALNVGVTGAVMFYYGKGDVFFKYILPHGMLELYAIFVAAGAGLYIFWSWISPGHQTRSASLAEAGRSMFTVVVGLVLALFVSGVIEGFVTPSGMPWQLKIVIGSVAWGGFLVYQFWLGRKAYLAGFTGDLGKYDSGAQKIYAG